MKAILKPALRLRVSKRDEQVLLGMKKRVDAERAAGFKLSSVSEAQMEVLKRAVRVALEDGASMTETQTAAARRLGLLP